MKLKIVSQTPTDTGILVEFQGLSDEGAVTCKDSLHFAKNATAQQVLDICMDAVEELTAPQPPATDLSALVGVDHTIDSDRYHPLHGITDPALAKATVKALIADRMESLIQASGLVDAYPATERDTWERQIKEALKHQGGEASAFITGVAAKGETPDHLAQSILDNAAGFLTNAAPLFKAKHELVKSLGALPNDVVAIKAFHDDHVAVWRI